ncbi:MAG: NPCBM/NEW2 domain-containing protein [Planctomycetota bacterium]
MDKSIKVIPFRQRRICLRHRVAIRRLLPIIFIIISIGNYLLAEIKITDIDNKVFDGCLIKFEDDRAVISSENSTPISFTYNNIAGITFSSAITASTLKTETDYFRIVFANQDVLYGTISDTGKDSFVINNSLIGKVVINFEQLSLIERAEDNKQLSIQIRSSEVRQADKQDNIFLVSGDTDSGVVISLTPETIILKSSLYNKERLYKIKEIKAVSFFSPAVRGRDKIISPTLRTMVYLVDNSQLSGSIIRSDSSKQNSQVFLSTGKTAYSIPIDVINFIYFRNNRCVYLSDIEPVEVKEYIVSPDDLMNTFLWHYQKDRSIFSGQPLSLNGKKHFKGLSVHANCELRYKLDNSYQRFFATIGLDDESSMGQSEDFEGSVKFIVYLDGQKVYESDTFKRTVNSADISINVKGGNELRLVVNDAGDGYILDRAAWVSAYLTK